MDRPADILDPSTTAPPGASLAATDAPHPPATRTAVASWVTYDLANTIFSMGVVTLAFPKLVRAEVGPERADTVANFVLAASMGVIFLLSPLLGALTDRSRRRMPFLIVSTLACVIACASIGHFGFAAAIAGFILANIAFQAGSQFYDSLLPAVSTESTRGKISGLGVGLGYIGSYIAIGLSFATADSPAGWMFSAVALGFLALALPCFLFVREPVNPRAMGFRIRTVTESARQVYRTFRSARRHPDLFRFLIARMLYTDAINTVISVMALFTLNVVKHNDPRAGEAAAGNVTNLVMLVAITTGIAGGLLVGRIVDRIGAKITLQGVLCVWAFNLLLAAVIALLGLPLWTLFALATCTGVAFGGVWTSDRPMLLRLCPKEHLGEYFGLYGMVGRFAAIAGPLIWGVVFWAAQAFLGLQPLQAQGVSLLVLLAILLAGLWLLRGVNDSPPPSPEPAAPGRPAPAV